jgi:TRAP-type C4-dicarboxylate transport system permease large subunit
LCILLSALLGALSGAAMAVAGLLGRSLFPEMRRRGYNTRLSAGTIMAAAPLGPIIPPSVLAIIIATLAEISTASLLVAGIIPGLLLMCLFLIYVIYRVWRDPSLTPDVAAGAGRAHQRAHCRDPDGAVRVRVLHGDGADHVRRCDADRGCRNGSVWRGGRCHYLPQILAADDGGSSRQRRDRGGALLVIMCCAVMFSQLLTFTGATRAVGELVADLRIPGRLMLLAMMALPFVLFMFLDQLALMLVLIPIYQPLPKLYAFDPIWFCTLFLIVATVGGLTPPFGYVLFALKSAAPDVPTTAIFRASWPFVWIIVAGMVILAVFPDLITFLPNLRRPR